MSINRNKKQLNILLPLLFALVLAFGMTLGYQMRGAYSSSAAGFEGGQNNPTAKRVEEIIRYIEAKYVDEIDTDELVDNAIESILSELDPHSNYISPEQKVAVNEDLNGNFEGVGIQFVLKEDTIYVVNTIEGGPSEKEGIRAGDKIVEIEGENVAGIGLKSEDVIKKLKGEKNTKVNIKIKRNGKKKLMPFTIERAKIPIYSLDAGYMLNENTGYIKLSRFSETTSEEFHQKAEELIKQGMQHLVLDLRDNPGGYLNEAIAILNQIFDDKKLMVYTKGEHHNKNEYKSTGRRFLKIDEVAVLIDEGSASASEIVAGAIQDWDRGAIIGRRSFGKGLVQEQYNLSNGGALRLTIARYYTPSGRFIQKQYQDQSAYQKEMYNRMDNGELMNKDSIDIADTTKYFTSTGRVVYGGGGITPDDFIPINKVYKNKAFLKSRQYIAPFVYNHLDKHRDDYRQFETVKLFIQKVNVSEQMLQEFRKYAKRQGFEMSDEDFNASKKEIARYIKSNISKQFFGNAGMYEVLNENDKMIKKALETIKK